MKKQSMLILVILVLFMLSALAAHAAPRLTLPESVFNFGYAPQNSKISHTFWMYSTGDDSLKIISVKPG